MPKALEKPWLGLGLGLLLVLSGSPRRARSSGAPATCPLCPDILLSSSTADTSLPDGVGLRLRTAQGQWVVVDASSGAVSLVDGDDAASSAAARWEAHTWFSGANEVQLRSVASGRWLAAAGGGGGELTADRDSASGWETWRFSRVAQPPAIRLQAFGGQYVRADPADPSRLEASAASAEEGLVLAVVTENPRLSRSLRGLNLGGWLVLEKWMTPTVFEGLPPRQDEDEHGLCSALGLVGATARLEAHWRSFLGDGVEAMGRELSWIRDAGFDALRVPFGHWLVKTQAELEAQGEPYVSGQDSAALGLLDQLFDVAKVRKGDIRRPPPHASSARRPRCRIVRRLLALGHPAP